jgi:hypothetical protein
VGERRKIITARLQKITEAIIFEEQLGFRNRRLCADCVHTKSLIINFTYYLQVI